MKEQTSKSNSGALPRIIKATFTFGPLPALVLLFSIQTSQANSATWNLNPTSGDWNTAANWTPATIPNGPDDTATFGVSNVTGVLAEFVVVELNGIVFQPGGSAFSIRSNAALTISGAGISNESGLSQNFITGDVYGNGSILFTNGATAGNLSAFINPSGCYSSGGLTEFYDTSNAGGSTFTNYGGQCGYSDGAHTYFFNSSSAHNGVFVNYSSDYFGNGGTTEFYEAATAANATLINTATGYGDGGITEFYETATAANATLIANGGSEYGGGAILLFGDSTGDKARVEVFDYSYLRISYHNSPGVTIGSLEGDGFVYLGANNLTMGSDNLSTQFSGAIDGSGGSLTKIGSGTLILSGANTYTGGTTVEKGELLVGNTTGSGLGTGSVRVNAGRLGGNGTIAGAVTLGIGTGAGAVLSPGKRGGKQGILTIEGTLTFNSESKYNCGLATRRAVSDKVIADGITINGAQFAVLDAGKGLLTRGTVFIVIDNTSATAIAGTFRDLPDGSTLTVGNNTFQASYEGGDGNDLTLTVE